MQLVEDEELEPACGLDELALERPREDQLEHHVVREQDVGWVRDDLAPLVVALLARVAAERDRALAVRIASTQELLELARLAVGKRIHRVDDKRLDPLARTAAQHVVDDRDDVGEALTRAGAG